MQHDDITIKIEDGIIFANVTAPELDEHRAQVLLHQVTAAVEKTPGPVFVNLTHVGYMPSMAIGSLVMLWKKLQDSHERFILVGTQAPVRRTLTICRLDKLFEFCDTEDHAKKRIHPHA